MATKFIQDYTVSRFSKVNARSRPLEVIRTESNLLWDYQRKETRCSWLELAGGGAPTCDLLLQEGALGKNFLGVDLDLSIVTGCKTKYADLCTAGMAHFHHGDLLAMVRGYSPVVQDVGVLVYDTQQGLPHRNLDNPDDELVRAVTDLIQFGKKQHKELGEFLLVINVTQQRASVDNCNRWPLLLAQKLVEAKVLLPEQVEQVRRNPDCLVGKYPCSKAGSMLFSLIRFGFGQVLCEEGQNPLGLQGSSEK